MEGVDLAELGLVALAIFAIGILISLVMVALSRRHERQRHKRLSTGRRKAMTELHLGVSATGSPSGPPDSGRRRRRRGSSRNSLGILGDDSPGNSH